MTYEQTREQFLLAWNSNAYLNMCESDDMHNAIVALEKQIPKKITHEATLQRCATCPTCKNVLDEFIEVIPGQPKTRVTFAHCYFCGQALDWSDNNG